MHGRDLDGPVVHSFRGVPMSRFARCKAAGRGCRALALAATAALLPLAASAEEIVTFDWVPTSENPTSSATTTASGTLTLTLSSWTSAGASNPPNFGPYYTSGANQATADITGLTFTSANGLTVNLSNVTTRTVTGVETGSPAPWETSGELTPSGASSEGYYLVSGFTLSGTTALGSPFMIANNLGTPGATYINGVPNADNTFNAVGSYGEIADGGYWEFAGATSVPLPAGLPLLLGGAGLLAWLLRRSDSFRAQPAAA